ncbi:MULTISPECIES: LytR C-terminal domain-containing protein [unclassified Nocardioides]|uniref:LytR C-terminal domain-containing protein n=1 Tax=unclassified Nocardioides TaxID=2615069 RepID=UPI001E51CE39|nr:MULTISPECIES: LytR C-terminal domain-containing protein [unclassified Nocardioides]
MARLQRSGVFPSPVVLLSIVAVVMAAVAFVATRSDEPVERDITPVAQPETTATPTPEPSATEPAREPRKKKPKPAVERAKVYVEVYNNSGISGLAGEVSSRASDVGWQVVGADNWYGTIPATTVYHPARLERAAAVLAKDLGIERVQTAVAPMKFDRLTVILTGPLN